MRKISKPAIIITLGVVALAVLLSVVVGMLLKGAAKKTRISEIDVGQTGNTLKEKEGTKVQNEGTNPVEGMEKYESTIGNTIKKEQQMLKESEKGGYVGGVGGSTNKKKNKNPFRDEIIMEEPEDQNLLDPSMPKNTKKHPIYNDPGGEIHSNTDNRPQKTSQAKQKAWEYLYTQKCSGGFVSNSQMDTQTTKDRVNGNPGNNPTETGPKVHYYKPYRAIIDRTFTSAQAGTAFVATCTQVPIKGWKVLGRANANFSDNRFHVEISGVISPDNTTYQMKGYAASIDETDGIVSAVKHEDVAGMVTGGVMSGVSSFFNALRKDATTIEVGSGGVTVTGQTKNEDRAREAGLAAGDTIFQGLSKKIDTTTRKNPTLIMEKGVPVLIYFTP